ncbi:uncharacterized protein SCHCODRAFT_02673803 [Schizophyllum commune H4-8]|uniref:uncharacterized protein n=1 Tax=Schizophyllum commune (strain H4-8 / FGSC 9210) TaxID=578458 RepID=UPI00215F7CA7|nr:uncharacterized protein SCHCODRAFT_02673803 [Schizophyllum commune H4-8]KAI5885209.1 hypothetical protein SCHCODRAFT_02673803 [Schizophyllum commune H4-8]
MAGYRLPASSPLDTLVRKTSQRRPTNEPARAHAPPPRPAPPPGSPLIRSRFDQARDDESVYTDASSFRARHAYSESKASTSYAGSSYSIYPADAGLEHYPPFNNNDPGNRAGHASEPSVDSYIDMNSPVDDDQPLADAQEAVLAGLTDTYRDDRPGSHQNYDSALRDSWPDAKRASEGAQRAASGRGRGPPSYAHDTVRADAKRPTPGRQDNPHASNAFKSVYSNVDSVYSQDDDRNSYGGPGYPASGRYTRNLDSIYSQDDDDQAYYADASGAAYADTSGAAYADASGAAYTANEDVPTVVVSSPITASSSRQASRQPIQQHIRNFSRPMPQSDAPPPGSSASHPQRAPSHSLTSPSNAFDRPESSYTAYSQDVSYNQDDSFAHDPHSFAHDPSSFSHGTTFAHDPASSHLPLPPPDPHHHGLLSRGRRHRVCHPSTRRREACSTVYLDRASGGAEARCHRKKQSERTKWWEPQHTQYAGVAVDELPARWITVDELPARWITVDELVGSFGYGQPPPSGYGQPSPSGYGPSSPSGYGQPPPSPKPNPYMTHSPSPSGDLLGMGGASSHRAPSPYGNQLSDRAPSPYAAQGNRAPSPYSQRAPSPYSQRAPSPYSQRASSPYDMPPPSSTFPPRLDSNSRHPADYPPSDPSMPGAPGYDPTTRQPKTRKVPLGVQATTAGQAGRGAYGRSPSLRGGSPSMRAASPGSTHARSQSRSPQPGQVARGLSPDARGSSPEAYSPDAQYASYGANRSPQEEAYDADSLPSPYDGPNFSPASQQFSDQGSPASATFSDGGGQYAMYKDAGHAPPTRQRRPTQAL